MGPYLGEAIVLNGFYGVVRNEKVSTANAYLIDFWNSDREQIEQVAVPRRTLRSSTVRV